jgi:tetraacyldisaccharide 4'-kinase
VTARAVWAERLQSAWWAPRRNALAWALVPASWIYRALAALQKARARPEAIGVPVIVVGNLVVGGAGKTPTVIALVRMLRAYGWTPGVVSRGHGRRSARVLEVYPDSRSDDSGDEPLLIRLRTGVPVFVGADRVDAARTLLRAHPEVDIVVSDDGMQHHRLARDAEIVVFDERGIGNGLCLPAGPLREPLLETLPPQRLVLYNASQPTTTLPGWLSTRHLTGVQRLEDWVQADEPAADAWQSFGDRPLLAAAGIACPERFFEALRAQGLNIVPRPLPDHHAYDTLPWRDDTPDVIVTEKDAVKLRGRDTGSTRVWVAPLDLEPDLGFAAAVKRLFPKPPAQ